MDPFPLPASLGTSALLDLSKATKLKELVFRSRELSVQWIVTALQTVNSKDLQKIFIYLGGNASVHPLDEMVHQEWVDLDHLLLQFWTSHSIRPKVVYVMRQLDNYTPLMFPEVVKKGVLDIFYQT